MITINLDVDDVTEVAYQNLSNENKEQIREKMCKMLRETINNVRATRIKKILEEITKDSGGSEFSAEILNELLLRGEGK